MKNSVGVVRGNALYPDKESLFRPSEIYPEYPFEEYSTQNSVYGMVRECFHILKLDETHYGQTQWNPLKEVVRPGDTVLIKPNMVRHINYAGFGVECLYTHPSVVAAVTDYVVIALKGSGKIVIADAPVQSCDFGILIRESGYLKLTEYYQKKGIDVSLMDFRNVKTNLQGNVLIPQKSHMTEKADDGIVVNIGKDSAFYERDAMKEKHYRITCYDPDEVGRHHSGEIHEYKIHRAVLESDVIINIPKPKTHRKAGMTGALKNIVGICTNKEYLPHHTRGSRQEGGDEYESENEIMEMASELADIKNRLMIHGELEEAGRLDVIYNRLLEKGKKLKTEFYSEGSWYGNDTIWRTISDLNKIVLYADIHGSMRTKKQRRMFHVGDMVISGHKEGPLLPEPVETGLIIMGEDPVLFDRIVCRIMGFRYQDIPSVENQDIYTTEYSYYSGNPVRLLSDPDVFSENVRQKHKFVPGRGWEMLLGNPYKDKLISKIAQEGLNVYVWGCGTDGLQMAEYFGRRGIMVTNFLDSDHTKEGTAVWKGVLCENSAKVRKENSVCIIAVPGQHVEEVKKRALEMNFTYVLVF